MTCHMPAAGNEWGSFTLAPGDAAISFLRLSAANWKVAERQNPRASNYRTERAWMEAPTGSHRVECPSRRNVSLPVSEEALNQVSICSLH